MRFARRGSNAQNAVPYPPTDFDRQCARFFVFRWQGVLEKRPVSSGFGRWQKRWLVLTGDAIEWYAEAGATEAKGRLPLSGESVVELDDADSPSALTIKAARQSGNAPQLTLRAAADKGINERSIMGHGVYLGDDELALFADTDAAVAHCPLSNVGLKSGFMDARRLLRHGIRLGLATDVSGGWSMSMWRAMQAAVSTSVVHALAQGPDGEPLPPDLRSLAGYADQLKKLEEFC